MTSLTVADAKPTPRPAAPCQGCTLDLAATEQAVPLLVVLHGDRERATVSADRWRAVAKQRGWAVLALQCPTVLGCKGSFWQWNGDPKWVLDQVAAVAHTASIWAAVALWDMTTSIFGL